MRRVCDVYGCEDIVKGHGLCSTHYQRWREHGDPTIVLTSRWDRPPWEAATDLPDWAGAACVDHRDDIAWVPTAETLNRRDTEDNLARARRVCRDCPVYDQCLAHAVTHREAGIWAGTTDEQRIRMRRPA